MKKVLASAVLCALASISYAEGVKIDQKPITDIKKDPDSGKKYRR